MHIHNINFDWHQELINLIKLIDRHPNYLSKHKNI